MIYIYNIYFKIQDYIRIDCSVDVCLYTAYIDADDDDDDDDDDDEEEEEEEDDDDEKNSGNVFLTGVSIDASKVQHH